MNTELKLSYLLTSRRTGAKKYIKRFKESKLIDDYPSSRKKTSISFFKEAMATLNDGFGRDWKKYKGKEGEK